MCGIESLDYFLIQRYISICNNKIISFLKYVFFRKSRSPTNKGRTVVVNNTTNQRSPSISPSRKHSISPTRRSYGGSSDDQVNNNAASGKLI